MNILGCLDVPTSGTYEIKGKTVAGLSPDHLSELRNREIGFVFQVFHLLPGTRRFGTWSAAHLRRRPARQSARGAPWRSCARWDRGSERAPHQRTLGGQKQRVAIARALVNRPSLLLADEPTGNLDTRSGEELMELLAGLNASGVTVVLVTHDPAIARRAHRTVYIVDGKLVSAERFREIRG